MSNIKKLEFYDIVWDVDVENLEDLDLPQSVQLSVDEDIFEIDNSSDLLSDKYGWCVIECKVREVQ